jgi:hypothetical protein
MGTKGTLSVGSPLSFVNGSRFVYPLSSLSGPGDPAQVRPGLRASKEIAEMAHPAARLVPRHRTMAGWALRLGQG